MEVKSIAIKPDLENKVQSPTNKHLILRLTVASCCYYKAGKEEKGVCGGVRGGLGLGQGSQSKRKSLISATVFIFYFLFLFIFFLNGEGWACGPQNCPSASGGKDRFLTHPAGSHREFFLLLVYGPQVSTLSVQQGWGLSAPPPS